MTVQVDDPAWGRVSAHCTFYAPVVHLPRGDPFALGVDPVDVGILVENCVFNDADALDDTTIE